jgi:hypothetical protein
VCSISSTSVNVSGTPTGEVTSRAAPVADRLRTVQVITPPPNEIEPPLRIFRRSDLRTSSTERSLKGRMTTTREVTRNRSLSEQHRPYVCIGCSGHNTNKPAFVWAKLNAPKSNHVNCVTVRRARYLLTASNVRQRRAAPNQLPPRRCEHAFTGRPSA